MASIDIWMVCKLITLIIEVRFETYIPKYQLSTTWKDLTVLVDMCSIDEYWYLMKILMRLNFSCKILFKDHDLWYSMPLRVCRWWVCSLEIVKTFVFFLQLLLLKNLKRFLLFFSSSKPFYKYDSLSKLMQSIDLVDN